MRKLSLILLFSLILGSLSFSADEPPIFNRCKACHGPTAQKVAPGQKTRPIAGLPKEKLLEDLRGYRAGTADNGGNKAIMYAQMRNVSDEDIELLAEYISKLPPAK